MPTDVCAEFHRRYKNIPYNRSQKVKYCASGIGSYGKLGKHIGEVCLLYSFIIPFVSITSCCWKVWVQIFSLSDTVPSVRSSPIEPNSTSHVYITMNLPASIYWILTLLRLTGLLCCCSSLNFSEDKLCPLWMPASTLSLLAATESFWGHPSQWLAVRAVRLQHILTMTKGK